MGKVFYFNWEISFMKFLQSLECNFITTLAKIFTILGEEYLLILIMGLIYWCFDKELAKKVSLSMLGSMLFGSLAKGLVLRRRPYMDNKEIKCIRAAHPGDDIFSESAQGYSLPSLHSAMSSSTYGTIALNKKKPIFIIIAILLPLLIGLSRPYLGVHYPTDVILGWTLGILSMLLFSFIEKKWGYKIGFIVALIIGSVGFIYCSDVEFYTCYGILVGSFLGFLFEEKKTKFVLSKKWYSLILRPLLGVGVFVLVNTLLKLPIKNINEDYQTFLLIYRLLRYTISTFVIIAIYPYIFKKLKI